MKKFLTFVLVLAMVLSVSSFAMAAPVVNCSGGCEHVAAVGTTHYDTFGEALNAAIEGSDKTVTIIGTVTGYSFPSKNCEGITIQGSSTGKVTGMFNVTGSNTTFKNATIKDLKFEGGNIVLSTATKSFEGFTITNCVFEGDGSAKPAIQIQKASGVSVDGLTISYNTINNYGGTAILLNGGGGVNDTVTISNNIISNVSGNAFQALNIKELSIEDNIVSNAGTAFNLYGTKKAVISGNDVSLTETNSYIVTYVSGKVELTADNNIILPSGEAAELNSANCHSDGGWADDEVLAIGGEKDTSGKYISGSFVGTEEGVKGLLGDALAAEVTDADGNTVYVVGADDIEEAAKDGGVSINVIQTSTTAENNVLEGLPVGTKVEVEADVNGSVTVDGTTVDSDNPYEVPVPPTPAPTKPARDSIKVTYNGGNSFSTSKSAVPTSVEIDGVEVPFTGDGKNFTVGCIDPNAEWVTVRWNSTSVTVNFTPSGAYFAEVAIPKTGDMPVWAAVAAFLGF